MEQTELLGDRLAEERKRRGLSQTAFGALGGVTVKTQVLYEKSERVPDANYLTAVADAGIDVMYVLTGKRSTAELAADEEMVLAGYRKLDARGRAGVLALIGGMQAPAGASVRVGGNVGQYFESDQTGPVSIDMGKRKKKP